MRRSSEQTKRDSSRTKRSERPDAGGRRAAARPRKLAWLALALLTLGSGAVPASEPGAQAAPPGTIEFVGENRVATANGSFREWRVVDSQIDFADLDNSFALVEVRVASLDTGIERRDEHLRNPDFFEVETYPLATARLHSPRQIGVGGEGRERFVVQIDLDIHGVQKTVEAEAWVESRSPLVVEGSVTLDRTDFGVGPAPSRWNPFAPKAEIPVRFRVEL